MSKVQCKVSPDDYVLVSNGSHSITISVATEVGDDGWEEHTICLDLVGAARLKSLIDDAIAIHVGG